jgi:hypothetical protein
VGGANYTGDGVGSSAAESAGFEVKIVGKDGVVTSDASVRENGKTKNA